MQKNQSDKLQALQAMRAFAALGVLLWHASIFIGPYGEGIGTFLFHAPSIIGVDLFFVICGFVIYLSSTRRTENGVIPISPAEFLIKRLTRILPLYFVCTLVLFCIERHSERQTWELLFRSLAFIPVQNASQPNIFSPTMTVGWSINYEVFFYILFSVALLFRQQFWKPLIGWALVIFVAANALGRAPAMLLIVTHPINLLFLSGILLGALYRSDIHFSNRCVAIAAVIVAPVPIIIQYIGKIGIEHGFAGVGGSLVFMLALTTIGDKTLNMRCNRILTYLGDISYSIYLTHPIVMWGVMWLNEYYAWGNPLSGWICVGATLFATVGVSSLSYHFMEMGISVYAREWALKKLRARRRYAISTN
jgi:exopolysaccharide production protein ExoZ